MYCASHAGKAFGVAGKSCSPKKAPANRLSQGYSHLFTAMKKIVARPSSNTYLVTVPQGISVENQNHTTTKTP